MKTFLKEKLSIDLDQPSTRKGLALVAAGAAALTGHPELLTATVTEAGASFGGPIGVTVPVVIGLWETLRNEFKNG